MPKYVWDKNKKSISVVADETNAEDIVKGKIKGAKVKGLNNMGKAELVELVGLISDKYNLNLK
jgi:hypothetical protein